MSEVDTTFAGSIPEDYDRHLVPLIFEVFARDIAQRAAELSPRSVLETATGSGVVTRALAAGAPAGRNVHRDRPQPANARLRRRSTDGDRRISWSTADAQALPFDDARFDLVCCQFGVMFFPDRPKGYREARRVLETGARFLFNVWDRIEENVFANDVTNALADVFPNDPPRFLRRTPHGYHDTALIRTELEEAGFTNVVIETKAEQSRAPSPHHVALAYCQGTPLRNEIEARDPGGLEAATNHAASEIANKHGSGPVAAKIQAHIVTAVAVKALQSEEG